MRLIGFFLCLLLPATAAVFSFAREKPPLLFESHEIPELTLTKNIKALKKDIDEDRAYHPARLSYVDGDGQTVTLNVSVKTRGKTRRNPRLCDTPPLAVRFNPEETKETVFHEQKKLKLVTHCKRRWDIYEQYLLREYLVYRLYNILTEKSFRVRLVRINYVDSGDKYRPVKRYAFFIEDEKKMAKRNNAKMDDTGHQYWFFKQKDEQILLSVFQFMIGNTDWSIPARHNMKIIRSGMLPDPIARPRSFPTQRIASQPLIGSTRRVPAGSLYAVPYDFDMSGIVDTAYARPHEKLQHKIKNVRIRYYRGLCRKQEEFTTVIALFNEKKAEIYALYKNFSILDTGYRKATLRYLDKFYKIINNPRQVKKHFVDNCKKLK